MVPNEQEQAFFPVYPLKLSEKGRGCKPVFFDELQALEQCIHLFSAVITEILVGKKSGDEKLLEQVVPQRIELFFVAQKTPDHLFGKPHVFHESQLVDDRRSGIVTVKE